MPGAAGRKAANHIYSTAKPDGLSIGAVGAGLVAGPILGLAGSQYDIDKLIYLGSTESGDPYVFVSRKESGLDSLEKLRARQGTQNRRPGRRPPDLRQRPHVRLSARLERTRDGRRLRRPGNRCRPCARAKWMSRANGADSIFQRSRDGQEINLLIFHASITIPKGNFTQGLAQSVPIWTLSPRTIGSGS